MKRSIAQGHQPREGRLLIFQLIATGIVCLSACAVAVTAGAQAPKDVVLSIAIERTRFAADAKLVAQVWNAAALEALDANRKVAPLERSASVASFTDRLELRATGVRAGERFRIRVTGASADGCNTTTGEQTSTAQAGTTRVNLAWETTLKACGQGGGV